MERIEYIHSKGLIHRDIKPENFLVGIGSMSNTIYAIDFGLTKRYKDLKTDQHLPYRDGRSLTGTARYASINTHLGAEQSRRDDLEGIINVFIYFLRGSLPWQGLPVTNRQEKYMRITQVKVETPLDTLCAGFPSEVSALMKYCRELKFEETPKYDYINKLLIDIGKKESFVFDNLFDWDIKKEEVKERTPIGRNLSQNNLNINNHSLTLKSPRITYYIFLNDNRASSVPEAKVEIKKDKGKPKAKPKKKTCLLL